MSAPTVTDPCAEIDPLFLEPSTDIATLVAQVDVLDLSWQDSGSCATKNPEMFYPEAGTRADDALAICNTCPARLPCLLWALAVGDNFGVWGGLTVNQRRKLMRSSDIQNHWDQRRQQRNKAIVKMLRTGRSIATVAEYYQVSTRTVNRVAAHARRKGIRLPPTSVLTG